jgi:TPR repeat protein
MFGHFGREFMRAVAFAVLVAWSALLTPAANSQSLNESYKEAPITKCDTYAADPLDPQRKTVGVPFEKINSTRAIPACESAVEQYSNSNRLGNQLGRALLKNKQFGAAFIQFRMAAQQGYAPAQLTFGNMHENGQGVPKDESQAFLWYRKAAEQGFAPAEH